jgi:hypothetical protein
VSLPERLTVRQLIGFYVDAQIVQHQTKEVVGHSFFIPDQDELILNTKSHSAAKSKPLDCEKLHARALLAFEQNRYFILIDNNQAENLEQEIVLTSQSQVTFLRLTPLVGG